LPVFYFNVRDGRHVTKDTEGNVLPDLDAAIAEAKIVAADLAVNELQSGRRVDGRKIEITDDEGLMRAVFAVRDIVD
jgi:hypothetical protein